MKKDAKNGSREAICYEPGCRDKATTTKRVSVTRKVCQKHS